MSDVPLLRQTFALLLEWWTGLRTVQAGSSAEARGLLADLDGEVVLVVVNADASETGLIERVHGLGLPVLAFGFEESQGRLTGALDAGADYAISLGAPVSDLAGRAAQLARQASGDRRQASVIALDRPPR